MSATSSGITPFAEGATHELHFSRRIGWFVVQAWRKSLPGHSQAMSAPRYPGRFGAHLPRLLRYARANVEPELSEEDWAECRRLCLAESPEFILDLPDYYAFFTYSMFRGRVVG